ncbi:MAG: tRNA lysidine(34) synthetase TilS [Lysobacterales bacterium]
MTATGTDSVAALIHAIEQALLPLPEAPVWIALSGGMDSSTLLACTARSALARARGLSAVHVHHGLHPEADFWADQVQAQARAWEVPCEVHRVQIDPRGQGLEAAAREARHAVFERVLGPDAAMLLAHHREDQAETLLLRMLRGTSVDGLGAMRGLRPCGRGWLARPWLAQPRQELQRAAEALDLRWIEDPANQDLRHDRSYLRQRIWPLLDDRFPALAERLTRLARHAASASDELEASAETVLQRHANLRARRLRISPLLDLGEALLGATVRRFARQLQVAPPGFHELQRLRQEVLLAQIDATPILRWQGHEFRRFREHLYLLPQSNTLPAPAVELDWPAGASRVELPPGLGSLYLLNAQDQAASAPTALQVRWRRGGERLRPAGKPHRRDLRLLFQELGVPPWQRERVPLLFEGKELLAAVGLVESARLTELWPGLQVLWEP